MYNDSPYRGYLGGNAASVKRISADQVRQFYRHYYTPDNTVIAIAGNVPPSRVRRSLLNYLEEYDRPSPGVIRSRLPELLVESDTISRFQPTNTATLLAGFAGPGLAHDDFPAWQLLSAVIGGGKSSRLWRAVRDTAGIGYVVRAETPPLLRESPLVLHLEYDPSRTGLGGAKLDPKEAGELMIKTARSVLEQNPTEKELDRAKTFTIGSFSLAHQRVRDRAYYLGLYELLGLGYEFDSTFPSRIAAVSLSQLKRIAEKYLQKQILVTLLPDRR
jgi:predicted Zn-dependent peptidase